MNEGAGDLLAELAGRTVKPEPVHDADYWRGALKVIAEREQRIASDIAQLAEARATLETARGLTAKAKADAILQSRNVLTRREVARVLGVADQTVTKALATELRKRGMGQWASR